MKAEFSYLGRTKIVRVCSSADVTVPKSISLTTRSIVPEY